MLGVGTVPLASLRASFLLAVGPGAPCGGAFFSRRPRDPAEDSYVDREFLETAFPTRCLPPGRPGDPKKGVSGEPARVFAM